MLPARHLLHHHTRPIFLRSQCTRHLLQRLPLSQSPSIRLESSLTSRILPPSIQPTTSPREKKVHKVKPLPLSPSPSPRSRRRYRAIWYLLAFIASGGITYTALQPDNVVNHVFHGLVRNTRVTIALIHCVYDYRMVMRRKHSDEELRAKEMSDCHTRCARRTLRVLEKNGGIYIKLGQHLAALSYLIPIVYCLH
jgi:hypothetical protein